MIKRTLYFGNPARLSLCEAQLHAELKTDPPEIKTVPIEDIGMTVIDHAQISITHGLMEALTDNNAAILFCDRHHIPHGLVLPMSAHTTFTENVRTQLKASEPLKKQLWRQTIQAKISNQATLLRRLEKPWEAVEALIPKVGSGDPANVEGRAAAEYWKHLFDELDDFTRDRDGDAPNALLNYGYAVLRAIMARSLVGSGLLPLSGIHHKNKYNPFCLADDIMEPYRPYVDEVVWQIVRDYENKLPDELNKEIKTRLLGIPTLDIVIEGNKSPLMIAAQRTTASLMRCFEGEQRKIAYPVM